MLGHHPIVRTALVGVAVAAVMTLGATAASASPAKGCAGSASSFDGKGRALDKVTAPGQGGTEGDPFHVDVNGTIDWKGSTVGVIRNGTYRVTVAGFNVASGKMKNADGNTSWSGHEDVGARLDKLPVLGWLTKKLDPTATLHVTYTVTGQGGTCSGTVVLKIGDDPAFTPLWLLSIVLFLFAFWALFWPAMIGRP